MLFSQIIPPSSSTTESKSLFFTSLFLLLSCIWGHHYHNSKFHESESEVAQSCPTLSDPMDCSLSGFPIHGIFQARVLEWIAISFSRGSSRSRDQTQVSCIRGGFFVSEPPRPSFNVLKEASCTLSDYTATDYDDSNAEGKMC